MMMMMMIKSVARVRVRVRVLSFCYFRKDEADEQRTMRAILEVKGMKFINKYDT